ncbi:hypothetical protein chiPu_0024440, partial [Chiloscyllium punctatum]|nr:hypothetical protein [Chiloscyllium punctatum]
THAQFGFNAEHAQCHIDQDTQRGRRGTAFSGNGCDQHQRAALRAGVWEPRWEKGAERLCSPGYGLKKPEKDPPGPGPQGVPDSIDLPTAGWED